MLYCEMTLYLSDAASIAEDRSLPPGARFAPSLLILTRLASPGLPSRAAGLASSNARLRASPPLLRSSLPFPLLGARREARLAPPPVEPAALPGRAGRPCGVRAPPPPFAGVDGPLGGALAWPPGRLESPAGLPRDALGSSMIRSEAGAPAGAGVEGKSSLPELALLSFFGVLSPALASDEASPPWLALPPRLSGLRRRDSSRGAGPLRVS